MSRRAPQSSTAWSRASVIAKHAALPVASRRAARPGTPHVASAWPRRDARPATPTGGRRSPRASVLGAREASWRAEGRGGYRIQQSLHVVCNLCVCRLV